MAKRMPVIIKVVLAVIAALLLAAACYLCYVIFTYSRLEDNIVLETEGEGSGSCVSAGTTYTAVTQNLGFGAYTTDFTFFMDGGTESRAASEESVISCIEAGVEEALSFSPDFILFQEIDTDSTRSFHIDEKELIISMVDGYSYDSAVNYHSAYLMYPLTEPHGASNSVIMTLSSYDITSALRRSLPISTSFSKFLDLERCYSVSRIPVDNGKELVVYNVHMSAYGGSPEIRTQQMTMLFEDMQSEYENGNYCLCGGDFNHDFTGTSAYDLNGSGAGDFDWAQPFPEELLPDCLYRACDYSGELTGSCRNCDIPYEPGNYTIIVDGFILSENISADEVTVVDTGFVYSDHNPVVLSFTLKE